jgi:hypothetical protein
MPCHRRNWQDWPPTLRITTISFGIKRSNAIFLPAESTQPCSRKSMRRLTPAISPHCREVACASVVLEMLSSPSPANSKSRRQKLWSLQGKSAPSVIGASRRKAAFIRLKSAAATAPSLASGTAITTGFGSALTKNTTASVSDPALRPSAFPPPPITIN